MNDSLYRKASSLLRKETFNVYFFAFNVYFWRLGFYADMKISVMKLISLAYEQIVKKNFKILEFFLHQGNHSGTARIEQSHRAVSYERAGESDCLHGAFNR